MIFPPFLVVPVIAAGVGVYEYFKGKNQTPSGQVVPTPAPAMPVTGTPTAPGAITPTPPGAITPAAPTTSDSNGWGKTAVALGVAFLGLKLLGAITRAMFPPSAPRVVISSAPGRRRSVPVQRKPGTRGRVKGVWEKRGRSGWSFRPFTRQRRR